MGERTKTNNLQQISNYDREDYAEPIHCLIFVNCNYREEEAVISDSAESLIVISMKYCELLSFTAGHIAGRVL